uniref:Uncharacterized protein n=1 Tax=Moniliophthora roreri TaxID=221103 RepID=A0A0W0F2X9_MONRR
MSTRRDGLRPREGGQAITTSRIPVRRPNNVPGLTSGIGPSEAQTSMPREDSNRHQPTNQVGDPPPVPSREPGPEDLESSIRPSRAGMDAYPGQGTDEDTERESDGRNSAFGSVTHGFYRSPFRNRR